VAVAVAVSEPVEQRARRRRIVRNPCGDRGVVAHHARRHELRGRHSRPTADHPHFLVDLVGQRDGAAQRDALRRVSAHHRIFHVEVQIADRRNHFATEPDAGLRILGLQPMVRVEHHRQEVPGHREVVELMLFEREQARAGFLDDADLDPADQRQLAPDQLRCQCTIGRMDHRRVALVTKTRIRLQHDALPAPPFLQPIRAGADRVRHHPPAGISVGVDHLARHRGKRGQREIGEQFVVGKREFEAQRIAVHRPQPFDRRVVVELPGRARLRHDRVGADEPAVDRLQPVRTGARIEHPLDRKDVVGGGEFASLPAEHRIVGKIDAGPDANRPGRAVGRNLRQRLRRVGHQPVRARKVVVAVERIEDRPVDVVRVQVAGRLRIEPGFRDPDRDPQHLAGIRLPERRAGRQHRQRPQHSRGDPQQASPSMRIRHHWPR
jgi:hypothetical protein